MKNLLRVSSILLIVAISAFNWVTLVEGTTKVQEGGWYPKYNATVNKVAFNQPRPDEDMEVYTMNPDGSGEAQITDDTPGTRNKGQPYWYLSGEYIIFTAEQDGYKRLGICQGLCEQPGLGRNNNVWIMKADGSQYRKMTDVPENGAHIRPSFSHDGTKIFWLEEYSIYIDPEGKGCTWRKAAPRVPGEEYCQFRIVWGDFAFVGGVPTVSNTHRIVFPHLRIILQETSGFSRDDQRIVFGACNPAEVEALTGEYTCKYGADIYTSDLNGENVVRITYDPLRNTENEEYSPDGMRLAYYQASGGPGTPGDWYVMSADGSDYPGTRVTFFSDPNNPDYIENVFGGEGDWLDNDTLILSAGHYEIFKFYSDIYTISADTPPTVSIVKPTDGSTVSGVVTIQVDATDDRDAEGTLTVGVSIDSGAWQAATYNSGSGYYELNWDTTAAADGPHTINARATDSFANTTNAAQVTVTVDNLPPGTVHVGDLDGVSAKSGKNWKATVTITVHDANHNRVANATVSGTWSGGYSGSASCITASNGQCSVTTGTISSSKSSVTFTVNNVTHATLTYKSSDNHDPDGDSNGTSITVSKP